jgi:hypothetical protein
LLWLSLSSLMFPSRWVILWQILLHIVYNVHSFLALFLWSWRYPVMISAYHCAHTLISMLHKMSNIILEKHNFLSIT